MAKLTPRERVALTDLVNQVGEIDAARQLRIGRQAFARALAGLEIPARTGSRIVARLFLLERGGSDVNSIPPPMGRVLELSPRRGRP